MKTEVHEVKLILKNCMASKSRQEQELQEQGDQEQEHRRADRQILQF